MCSNICALLFVYLTNKRDKDPIQSVYGSFFEYSDLKPNLNKQLTVSFFVFSDSADTGSIQRFLHIGLSVVSVITYRL